MALTVASLEMFWTFIFILMFCELGEMVCNQFEMFNDSLEQCNWYSLPIEMQQMMIIFMANAQQPTWISGFGNILCTRDTFKKVISNLI